MNTAQLYTLANEGKRYQSYDDKTGETIGADGLGVISKNPPQGTLTIGVGHTGQDFKPGDIWTEAQIQTAFDADYSAASRNAYSLFGSTTWNDLGEQRQAVLIDMAFELGLRGLTEFARMLAACRAQIWQNAAAEILASKYALQSPLRANRNARMLENGIWV